MAVIEIEGQQIGYTETGDGRPIVYVHGSFATSSAWRSVIENIDSTNYRSIAIDLPGCGKSDAPFEDESVLQKDILAVENLARRVVGAPIQLVGHSYGGLVCLGVALAKSIPLASLTLFEPLPLAFLSDTGDTQALDTMIEFVTDYKKAYESGDPWAFSRVVDLWGGEGTFEAMPMRLREVMTAGTSANIRQWQDNLRFTPTLDAYRSLNVNTTLVVGQHAHPTSRLITQRLSELLPNSAIVELVEVGHFMLHSHGAQCANILTA